jgi:histidyl-tRNA synthetase
MKSADRSGAKFAIILGEDELAAGTVVVKDLVAGTQESVPVDSLIENLKAQLKT